MLSPSNIVDGRLNQGKEKLYCKYMHIILTKAMILVLAFLVSHAPHCSWLCRTRSWSACAGSGTVWKDRACYQLDSTRQRAHCPKMYRLDSPWS